VRTRAEEMELRKRVGVMFGKNRRAVKSAGGEEKTKGLEKKEVSLSFHHNPFPFFVFLSLSPSLFFVSRTGSDASSHSPSLSTISSDLPSLQLIILPSHLTSALETARPSVPASERHRLGRIYSEFVDERSPGGLDGAEGGGDRVGSRVSLG